MSRDFTLQTYGRLLAAAKKSGYILTSYEDFILNGKNYPKVFVLRHDVDALPQNSLATAKLEAGLGVKGSYYFRIAKQNPDSKFIKEIAQLGHEIGYHYENMAHAGGNVEKAFEDFKKNLQLFKSFYPVKTICMHGSPLSKWDNREIWKKYDYKELGVIAEPYFDLDFNSVFYLTDTGRSWNRSSSSVRDKVTTNFQYSFQTTEDIIKAFEANKLPAHIMLNIHPQRWTDNYFLWVKELIFQNIKNIIKAILVKRRK